MILYLTLRPFSWTSDLPLLIPRLDFIGSRCLLFLWSFLFPCLWRFGHPRTGLLASPGAWTLVLLWEHSFSDCVLRFGKLVWIPVSQRHFSCISWKGKFPETLFLQVLTELTVVFSVKVACSVNSNLSNNKNPESNSRGINAKWSKKKSSQPSVFTSTKFSDWMVRYSVSSSPQTEHSDWMPSLWDFRLNPKLLSPLIFLSLTSYITSCFHLPCVGI